MTTRYLRQSRCSVDADHDRAAGVGASGLCAGKLRAAASLLAHNGKRRDPEPAIETNCG